MYQSFLGRLALLFSLVGIPGAAMADYAPMSAEDYNRGVLREHNISPGTIRFTPLRSEQVGPLNISYSAMRGENSISAVIMLTNRTGNAYCTYTKARILFDGSEKGVLEDGSYKEFIILPHSSILIKRAVIHNAGRLVETEAGYELAAWRGDMAKPAGTGQRCGPNEPAQYKSWKAKPFGKGGDLVFDLVPTRPAPTSVDYPPAVPKSNPGTWLSFANLDPELKKRMPRSLRVNVRLTVGKDGRVTGCTHDGNGPAGKPFGDAACKSMSIRARFKPPIDAAGNPAVGVFETHATWQSN
ncbi:energy transducer TonB [Sphingosinicella microcystinivorans]|uniref:TonB-like protein n=1 Tax=Sphingosinicella microcystinivorans TaxID=335406 RepID=A0AAD1D415_SPHMI|nr:hypothetical protein [Sphingosinicella microcystinivorans]RKS85022.1 hypothetical protein DFR51_3622 [Sphingosinicella microcystinivorans]BBE33320.1 hypothetical protein SmB9_09780 [Sphingosinicella microcystinivorans]